MIWEYDDIDKFWLAGTPAEGCGVERRKDKKFYGNISLDGNVTHVGPFDRKEDAMAAAELELERRQKEKRINLYGSYDLCL